MYMLISGYQNSGQNHKMKIGSISFGKVAKLINIFGNDSNKAKFDSLGN
jgi:hypothetical protein